TSGKLKFPSPLESRFWSLVASYALGALPVGAISYLAALYLSRAFGLTIKQLGFVLWIPPAGLELGYFFWGWVSDRFAPSILRPDVRSEVVRSRLPACCCGAAYRNCPVVADSRAQNRNCLGREES